MLFMKFAAFGSCMGITYVDTTMIPVCNNVRRYFNKVFCSQTSPQQSRLKVQRLIHSFLEGNKATPMLTQFSAHF